MRGRNQAGDETLCISKLFGAELVAQLSEREREREREREKLMPPEGPGLNSVISNFRTLIFVNCI